MDVARVSCILLPKTLLYLHRKAVASGAGMRAEATLVYDMEAKSMGGWQRDRSGDIKEVTLSISYPVGLPQWEREHKIT